MRVAELTGFEWDRMHVFGPYSTPQEVYDELGEFLAFLLVTFAPANRPQPAIFDQLEEIAQRNGCERVLDTPHQQGLSARERRRNLRRAFRVKAGFRARHIAHLQAKRREIAGHTGPQAGSSRSGR